jgi:hypothetical protein
MLAMPQTTGAPGVAGASPAVSGALSKAYAHALTRQLPSTFSAATMQTVVRECVAPVIPRLRTKLFSPPKTLFSFFSRSPAGSVVDLHKGSTTSSAGPRNAQECSSGNWIGRPGTATARASALKRSTSPSHASAPVHKRSSSNMPLTAAVTASAIVDLSESLNGTAPGAISCSCSATAHDLSTGAARSCAAAKAGMGDAGLANAPPRGQLSLLAVEGSHQGAAAAASLQCERPLSMMKRGVGPLQTSGLRWSEDGGCAPAGGTAEPRIDTPVDMQPPTAWPVHAAVTRRDRTNPAERNRLSLLQVAGATPCVTDWAAKAHVVHGCAQGGAVLGEVVEGGSSGKEVLPRASEAGNGVAKGDGNENGRGTRGCDTPPLDAVPASRSHGSPVGAVSTRVTAAGQVLSTQDVNGHGAHGICMAAGLLDALSKQGCTGCKVAQVPTPKGAAVGLQATGHWGEEESMAGGSSCSQAVAAPVGGGGQACKPEVRASVSVEASVAQWTFVAAGRRDPALKTNGVNGGTKDGSQSGQAVIRDDLLAMGFGHTDVAVALKISKGDRARAVEYLLTR